MIDFCFLVLCCVDENIRFSQYINDTEESDMRPIFTDEGYTFVYIKVC
jgi:hypothetical protein